MIIKMHKWMSIGELRENGGSRGWGWHTLQQMTCNTHQHHHTTHFGTLFQLVHALGENRREFRRERHPHWTTDVVSRGGSDVM